MWWILGGGWWVVVVVVDGYAVLCCAALLLSTRLSQPKAQRKGGRDRAGRRKPFLIQSLCFVCFLLLLLLFLQPRPPTQIIVFAARLSS